MVDSFQMFQGFFKSIFCSDVAYVVFVCWFCV